jgi:hypothetical protein
MGLLFCDPDFACGDSQMTLTHEKSREWRSPCSQACSHPYRCDELSERQLRGIVNTKRPPRGDRSKHHLLS